MSFFSILMLALGLAMDATAVAVAKGFSAPKLAVRHYLLIALYFGGFQALMPLLGWLVGHQIGGAVAAYDHWIAFVLLSGLGSKMLWEASRESDGEDVPSTDDAFGHRALFGLAIATSIDALVVGVTLPMLHAPLVMTIATIGVVTALLSALGLGLGRRIGAFVGNRLDAAGGIVLILLGISILVEHLAFEG